MTSKINATDHGLDPGDSFYFTAVEPDGTGVDEAVNYYVLPGGDFDLSTFNFSTSPGGTPFTLSTNITSGRLLTDAAYAKVTDGVMDPPTDPSPPADVTGVSSAVSEIDGTTLTRLTVFFSPITEDKTRLAYVEITFTTDNDAVDPAPLWTQAEWDAVFPANPSGFVQPKVIPVPVGASSVTIDNVVKGREYWIRTWSEDVYGKRSANSAPIAVVALVDTVAPAQPTGLRTASDIGAVILAWSPSSAKDISFSEIRYAPDNGSGTAPDTTQWTTLRSRTTQVYIGGLVASSGATPGVADRKYWFQVRHIDTSGNVELLTGGVASAVDFDTNQETGWCDAVSGEPRLAGSADLGKDSVTPTQIAWLDAGKITTGTLKVSTNTENLMDGITIYDHDHGDARVGYWDETGLYVISADDSRDYVRLFNGGISVFSGGVETAALTPAGVSTAAFVGAMPGGHNLIVNSGFELYTTLSSGASSSKAWSVAADWNGGSRVGSDTNISTGTELTMTAVGF